MSTNQRPLSRFFLYAFFLFAGLPCKAQTWLYQLNRDSVELRSLLHSQKTILVYKSYRSCQECFGVLNDWLKRDTVRYSYYFIIEGGLKSALFDYQSMKLLQGQGIPESRIYFIKAQSENPSPYLRVVYKTESDTIPYKEVFDRSDKTMVTERLKKLLAP